MQLEPNEHAIFAYFTDDNDARNAATALRQAGYQDIRIDRIGTTPPLSINQHYRNSLSSLTMHHRDTSLTSRPLIAADPAVSGMSADYESMNSFPILLTMVCNDRSYSQAIELLRNYGASV
ncbi:MAG: hypothetical protein ACOX6E_01885 [Syntrophomonadaceae bacterium]|jgi:hypothetical protein